MPQQTVPGMSGAPGQQQAMLNGMTPAAMMDDYRNSVMDGRTYYSGGAPLSGTDALVAALIDQSGYNKDAALKNATTRFGDLGANPATRGWQDAFNRIDPMQISVPPQTGNSGAALWKLLSGTSGTGGPE
jgi:hypothetical protein